MADDLVVEPDELREPDMAWDEVALTEVEVDGMDASTAGDRL